MDLAVLLGASLLVLVGAVAIASLLAPRSTVDAAVTTGVVASAEVALLIGAPGAIGELHRGAVLAALLVATAATLALVARRRPTVTWRLPAIAAARRHPWTAALVAGASAAIAWRGVIAAVLPVYAYDALTYHGATLAVWLQRGDLTTDPLVNTCCSHYPGTAELLSAWPMLLLGSDAAVDLVQLGFVLLGAAAVAGLCRSASLPRPIALGGGAMYALSPIVLAQASTSYLDVIVGAWALAGLHSLVRLAATSDGRHAVVVGLTAGMLAGTKGIGIVWGGALVLGLLVVLALSVRRRATTARAAWRGVVVVAALVVTFGSFWYVRNWVDTGNPMYPFRVEVAGVEVFDGPYAVDDVVIPSEGGPDEAWPEAVARSWAADLTFWEQRPYEYQERQGGLGPAWSWLALPLLVPVAIVLARRRSPAVVAVVLVGAVFLVQPFRWWSRFTLPLGGLGFLAVAAAVAWVPWPVARRALQVASLALAAAGAVLASYDVDPAGRGDHVSAADVLHLAGDPAEEKTLGRLFHEEYRFLDDVPDDATVVVDVEAEAVRFVYPLYGRSWTREVIAAAAAPELGPGTWVVTARGRPLDRELQRDGRFELVADVDDLRAWHRP